MSMELRRQTANIRRIAVAKIGHFVFFLAVGSCPAQYFPAHCCALGNTPSRMDWPDVTFENVAPAPTAQDQASGESISAIRLGHRPPAKARKAFLRGVKFSYNGDYSSAAAEFATAAAVDPEFSDAHGNLAVEYTWLGRLDDAVGEFQRALQLDPSTALNHSNFSYTLTRLNRYVEAEAEAQAAVGLDPSLPVAQFLLGVLLARRPETQGLSENHLLYAARSVPEAHLALAHLYRERGESKVADAELKCYRDAAAIREEHVPAMGLFPRR